MQQTERLAALKRVPILSELPAARLEQLASTCKWQDYDAGEHILSYHDPSTEAFFLAAGKVRVIIYSAEGKAVVFTELKAGAMFGEIAAIDRGARFNESTGLYWITRQPCQWRRSHPATGRANTVIE